MATPADPVLASTLLSVQHDKDARRIDRPTAVSTGCDAIDQALDGGPRNGELNCLSTEFDSGAREIVTSILATHLLSAPRATATVIDSALTFDIRKLHQALTARSGARSDASKAAMEALDRLKIMKVFDATGLTESLLELRETFESPAQNSGAPEPPMKSTIADSDEDEEEMLDEPNKPPLKTHDAEQTTAPYLLIIDTITHPFAPLLRINHVQGQAVLLSFTRSLLHLTRTHDLCTLLINDAYTHRASKEEPPSIFSSCTLRPALGKWFAHALDTHLLLHQIPRDQESARSVYGHGGHAGAAAKSPNLVSVVEVLQDRNSGRVGKWAAFAADANGALSEVK